MKPEYFIRIDFIRKMIEELNIQDAKILDVGGAAGRNLLEKVGIKNVTTLDTHEGADIIGDAKNIPIDDCSYDIVTCIDMLEHIRSSERNTVIQELLRVAKVAVFITAPRLSLYNKIAEEIVLKYINDGFLREHKKYGLVDFREIEEFLHQPKLNISSMNYDILEDLYDWVMFMTNDQGYDEAKILKGEYRREVVSILKSGKDEVQEKEKVIVAVKKMQSIDGSNNSILEADPDLVCYVEKGADSPSFNKLIAALKAIWEAIIKNKNRQVS